MNYWLVKSEPSVYSFDQFIKEKKTSWTGVRNYAARLNLAAMKKGDKVLYYHSNEGTHIIGMATVLKESYPDPTTDDPRWITVDLKAGKKLTRPVTLEQLKKDSRIADMDLVRLGRLSVQKVKEAEWNIVMEMAEEEGNVK